MGLGTIKIDYSRGKSRSPNSGRVGNVEVDTLWFFNLSASLASGIGMAY